MKTELLLIVVALRSCWRDAGGVGPRHKRIWWRISRGIQQRCARLPAPKVHQKTTARFIQMPSPLSTLSSGSVFTLAAGLHFSNGHRPSIAIDDAMVGERPRVRNLARNSRSAHHPCMGGTVAAHRRPDACAGARIGGSVASQTLSAYDERGPQNQGRARLPFFEALKKQDSRALHR